MRRRSRRRAVVLLNRYRIDVPSSIGAAYWFIEAVLGVDFLSGAQYGLLLRQYNASSPLSSLSLLPGEFNCLSEQSCEIGSARFENEKFLKVLVAPGSYELWIYERPMERISDIVQVLTERQHCTYTRIAAAVVLLTICI
jgi:hypothetical protein